ncbi:transcriptional regulator/sugar kinase [Frankia casuarinae]|jgi:glucokinase|uniref:Glucokinase n=1 Tax=Frankia casuarinae (strain DSM 45818 / CECT 9043 / HFP020203 / CcI3) TaxID=106370 RepID=Q2J6T7_FRACC|nr:ROK family protein [Frankia casuarinae]ABD13005.1 glucokinase [Frankia casuarinae]EYT92488.1 transcriptional regulator/sugar kinase [Frankia casuarinae]
MSQSQEAFQPWEAGGPRDVRASGKEPAGAEPARADGRKTFALALDIGGTKIAAGVVAGDGTIAAQARRSMPVPRPASPASPDPDGAGPASARAAGVDAEEVFAVVQDCLDEALAAARMRPDEMTGLGCGCSGPMDWPVGEVSPLNIPAWRGFPLRARLRDAYPGGPVLIHNDAVALAAGEHWMGEGRGVRNMLAVTVSTGVGGGLVLGGRLLHGTSGNAGHIGHMVVEADGPPCPCGGRGCLEALASGPRTVAWAIGEGWVPSGDQPANGRVLAASARAGDGVARRALARAGAAVGAGLASCASLLDLEAAVVAGGFAQSGPIFWDALSASFDRHTGLAFTRRMQIRRSSDPSRIALRGAGAFILAPERYAWEG